MKYLYIIRVKENVSVLILDQYFGVDVLLRHLPHGSDWRIIFNPRMTPRVSAVRERQLDTE